MAISVIGVNIPFGGYLFYVCFGCMMAKINVNKKITIVTYVTLFVSTLTIILISKDIQLGYKNLVICAVAMSVFVLIIKMEIKPNKILLCISNCTWGIYLIHPFFINIVIKLLKIDVLSSYAYIKLFVFAIVVTVVSFFTAYVLRKIPIVKKLF